ncbi:alpha/beta hydrolase (plasmid) [Rhizobium sullae]|uniref:Alpha/beta hydrolase n=1 Tax=Rhizobium sullae TaxID=50338 RepID=A0ABY5XT75_RHISU|nr:alpha/beta hydrolase [Rhizobium sullae]UWU17446.1 alpha/beta hydrolase [Rhizobium sullae]
MTTVEQGGWTNRKRLLFLPDGPPMAFIDSGGPGPVLLLLHGYSDSSRSFSLLEPWLSAYRLVVPDLPGHGASAVGSGLAVSDFADDVAALVGALGIDRCIVVGHSMGAMIGMTLTDLLPEMVGALVMISGTLRPTFPKDDLVTEGILSLSDPINPADPLFDLWHAGPYPIDRTFLDPVSREAAAIPSSIWKGILGEFSRLDMTRTASRISVPVLCIAGSEDMLFDAGHRLALASALPDAKSVLMDGFGHNPHWEDPEQVALHVERFLQGVLVAERTFD